MTFGTIVIPAHDEEAVIGRTLEPLRSVAGARVVVVCNGCVDRTAEVARSFGGVEVIEIPVPSKAAALRVGDARAAEGPRIYLDADIVLTAVAVRDLIGALAGDTLAGRPPHVFDTAGASWMVRRWYAVRKDLPSIAGALWGAGCYALSVEGRARFGDFPDIVSDDLFVDSLFTQDEITIIDTDPVVVTTPRRTRDLVRILVRSYRTQGEVQAGAGGGAVSSGQKTQLTDLARIVRQEPGRVLDAAVYVGLVGYARLRARRPPASAWERDTSSRETRE
ncbi:glycosyltransferase [Ornithinimicrobium pekingense]|uniref:4,4'-diaponeurosporenoate glycosyltransferase n=1 Tax=Ornithinimicrobium pekingense TaxID=384677 RepID=A0ABQ2FAZ8_9MICO|nr:glycosyltransferase [Ornithinimicrobium pekingense]GGK71245.1 hypothetical protein GCM10011509_19640 [Ornithinimicrobium pekingense]